MTAARSTGWDDDKPREECGVFGAVGVPNASAVTALGLHGLQHRGQESCGIVAADGDRFHQERHFGLVGENLAGPDITQRLPGDAAIGHVRYTTQGASNDLRNVQPIYADLRSGGFAVAHNGNLTNARTLRRRLVREGKIFQATSDTEVVLHLAAISDKPTLVERFIDALDQVEGGYAFVALAKNRLIAARDPFGIRPLVLGDLDGAPVVASESSALKLVGATFLRDIAPGEVVVLTPDAPPRSIKRAAARRPRTCAFEYIYFARPDSVIDGVSVYAARKAMGRILAEEHPPLDADVVVPVPDSGMPAAIGYAETCGLPFALGIIRSHFVGRTFIDPTQEGRVNKVRMKHQANVEVLKGKRVVLVDDSIVRGTTSWKIVELVRQAGAEAVHFRSSSPQIRYPDFYGIDMADREELLAARLPSLDSMCAELGVDSLGFLSVDGLYNAVHGASKDPAAPQLADHYFTGDYPTRLTDAEAGLADRRHPISSLEAS